MRKKRQGLTTELFIHKAKNIHGNKYNYSLVNYINNKTKIKIICPVHGIFKQSPHGHLSGNGCDKCAKYSTTEEFIDKSIHIHNDKYDYSLVKYINNKTKVKIICIEHGIFEQKPSHHLLGSGCPTCNESKGEKEISKILKNYNINYIREKRFVDCRNKLPLPFDFYLPEYNLCIEFDGQQHFEYIKYWKNDSNKLKIRKFNDDIKTTYCKNNNIKLLRIRYDEIIEEKLKILYEN